jgi:hypothetical protein
MKLAHSFAALAVLSIGGISQAGAACNISDAKLEEAILQKPELLDPINRKIVLDLRALRDAAFVLWSYDRIDDCERLLGNIRELIASPSLASLGGNDEDQADQQLAAGEPMSHRNGQVAGNRSDKNARPLLDVADLAPGLRSDEIVGSEVRTSDDQIVGEVRNLIVGTGDGQDYVIVASGGFFVPGKDSYAVPIRHLQVDEERASFFLRLPMDELKSVPILPDDDYDWLSDKDWRSRNDARFAR